MVFDALQAVLMIIVIMAFGFFCGWRKWAGPQVTSFISKLILNITLPCTGMMSFVNYLDAETIKDSWLYIVAAFVAILIMYFLAKIVARAAKIKKTQRGVFITLFAFSNSIYVGLPVATAIFGEPGIVFAMFYFVANTTLMNSIGMMEIAADGREIADEATHTHHKMNFFKILFQPPLIGVIIGVVLVMLNVQLPSFLSMALTYTGNITSPLALIFIGIVLQRTGLSCIRRFDRGISWSLVGRFVLSPLIMFFVAQLFGLGQFPTSVLVVQMGLPAMVATSIFAEATGADTEFAARGVAITTLVSFVTIPIYIALLGL